MKATLTTIACGILATCALSAPAFAAPGDRSIGWSGNVDDTAIVRIHADQVITRTIHGNQTTNVTFDVHRPLPADRPLHVWLTNVHGRGTVQVVREPNADNNYTAVVKIYDPQAGAAFYHFDLHWNGRHQF
jgi:hypothetical protein